MDKSGFSSEDLDLKLPFVSLKSLSENRSKLLERVLSLVTDCDINQMKPCYLKVSESNLRMRQF